MISLGLHASQSLQPTLSPRLQRAVKLLQMSAIDFSQVVRDAMDTNPFLEPDESLVQEESLVPEAAEHSVADGGGWDTEAGGRSRTVDGDNGVFDTLMAPLSLSAHLTSQLNLLWLPERDLMLARAIVESLDDDGYLRSPLDEVAGLVPLVPEAEPQELMIALRRVQSLEPAGIGARSAIECLQLQIPSIPDTSDRDLATTILGGHVQALAGRDMNGLARRLGVGLAPVEAACAAIRRLDPRPGWRFGAPPVQYVTPDVIVKKVRGQWIARLNQALIPRVRVNRSYADLFSQHRSTGQAELGLHLQEAKWTVRNVEQRFSTILSVAQAILERQQHFLAYGAMAMKPLALREIADAVGVHESTVSRVTNNKFMATPCGVFELKYFFSRGLATASGGECSPTAIRSLIQDMVSGETATQPLSDVEIARQLSVQGLIVARRTVTKYRQLMKIEPAERRRASGANQACPAF